MASLDVGDFGLHDRFGVARFQRRAVLEKNQVDDRRDLGKFDFSVDRSDACGGHRFGSLSPVSVYRLARLPVSSARALVSALDSYRCHLGLFRL